MFSWIKNKFSKAPPPQSLDDLPGAGENPLNPGRVSQGNWTYNDGVNTRAESMDLNASLGRTLAGFDREVSTNGSVLNDLRTQFSLRPLLVSMEPVHQKGIKTTTTIEIAHPTLIPKPIFDFQHSFHETFNGAIDEGFRIWYELDFVTLLDALSNDPATCMELRRSSDGSQSRQRRITLGPVQYMQTEDPPQSHEEDEHPFCPCCLFTNTAKAFQPFVDSGDFYAIRLFASRSAEGVAQSDCRVNGIDDEAGRQALLQYIESWPDRGFEFRKQYVLLHG